MVQGKLPVPGRPTIWISVGQGPTALAVGAGGGRLDIFTLIYPFFSLSPSLWETARYRLKYCLKGPLNPKSTTNEHSWLVVLGLNDPLRQYFSLYRVVSQRYLWLMSQTRYRTIYSVCQANTTSCLRVRHTNSQDYRL